MTSGGLRLLLFALSYHGYISANYILINELFGKGKLEIFISN